MTDSNVGIPSDVLAQFLATRGKFGVWLPTVHSNQDLLRWGVQWRLHTDLGREVAEEEARLHKVSSAEAEREMSQERQREMKAASLRQQQRDAQEAYRLPLGSAVRIKALQTHLDGRVGTLRAMEFVGDQLMAEVEIDPLEPGHPMREWPIRDRPLRFMPLLHSFPAIDVFPQSVDQASC